MGGKHTPSLRRRHGVVGRQYVVWRVGLLAALVLLVGCSVTVGGHSAAQTPTLAAQPSPSATVYTGAGPQPSPSVSARLAQQEYQALIQQSAAYYTSQMTLDEKIGQMFLIETYYQDYTPDIDNMVVGMHAGAMIIYGKNMSTPAQLKQYIASIQAHATIPLLVTMDEEGGLVDRLGYYKFFPPLPSAETVGASGNPQNAYNEGMQAAREMLSLGINTNLAPVVDVRTVNGQIETTRIYGTDPTTVYDYASQFLLGLQSQGVIGTLKHWPGIGSITTDPHLALPIITRTKAQMESVDFATFRQMLALNPGMVMVTHVMVPAFDPKMPATLSPILVNGILRGELGYNGVVMTDSLYMKAIADKYTLPQAAVLSIEAGDDLLEGAFDTNSMSQMIAAIKAAMSTGAITVSRINQSVQRILALKIRYGLLPLHDSRLVTHGSPTLAVVSAGVTGALALVSETDVRRAY
ncbi:MAG TPA: glycoside hydrolase family 3 N-terminal domain-containing protein [Ktedonobacterales bacterium]|nr:glycoside hydrolase family 3 N-terminal domain-containing protein [Ktedonobacterales bacterium]